MPLLGAANPDDIDDEDDNLEDIDDEFMDFFDDDIGTPFDHSADEAMPAETVPDDQLTDEEKEK